MRLKGYLSHRHSPSVLRDAHACYVLPGSPLNDPKSEVNPSSDYPRQTFPVPRKPSAWTTKAAILEEEKRERAEREKKREAKKKRTEGSILAALFDIAFWKGLVCSRERGPSLV